MTREQAQRYAEALKREGYTNREICTMLKEAGYRNKRTGTAYSETIVSGWTRGCASQRGQRNPRLLSDEERRKRQAQAQREWNQRNAEYLSEYFRWYRVNFKNKKAVRTQQPRLADY